MIFRFDSPGDFARAADAMPEKYCKPASRWLGGESTREAIEFARDGNAALVDDASTLLDKLQTQIETPTARWEPSVAGAYPIVPEAIAGFPEPMRCRTAGSDDRAPIRVFVVITASSAVSTDTIRKRGVAILALAMALGSVRPFELYAINIYQGKVDGETVICTRINTTPLDLASACYVLTSAGFMRALCYQFSEWKQPSTGHWPDDYRYGNAKPYLDDLRARLGGSPDDLMIAPTEMHDKLAEHPVEWVNEQIARYTEGATQ